MAIKHLISRGPAFQSQGPRIPCRRLFVCGNREVEQIVSSRAFVHAVSADQPLPSRDVEYVVGAKPRKLADCEDERSLVLKPVIPRNLWPKRVVRIIAPHAESATSATTPSSDSWIDDERRLVGDERGDESVEVACELACGRVEREPCESVKVVICRGRSHRMIHSEFGHRRNGFEKSWRG